MKLTILTSARLAEICGVVETSNLVSIHEGLATHGVAAGLDRPHRLVPYLAQTSHESQGFKYDRELWGPTPAQRRYDTRTDLGNTPELDGDGHKNRGRTSMQITGGYNIGKFTDWCRTFVDRNCPDFRVNPDLMNTDPWEGLGPIWYWTVGNPGGQSLNRFADVHNFGGLTQAINGGYNGYADRLARYGRIGLAMLGYSIDRASVLQFQASCNFTGRDLDGVVGPQTRSVIHRELLKLPPVSFIGLTNPAPLPAPRQSFWSWLLSLFATNPKGTS